MPSLRSLAFVAGFALALLPSAGVAAESKELIGRIKAVGAEGAGNADAAKAWKELVQQGPSVLIDTLAALDDANPTTANWLRAAVDAIAERELKASKALPQDKLEAFVRETKHSGQARRLAFDWLVRVDKTATQRLIPGMLDDPGAELRRDAVAQVVQQAEELLAKGDKVAAAATFGKALFGARDSDQVIRIADQLQKLGITVDRVGQFGFIRTWMLAGPFDSTGGAGFQAVYPPEKGVDLAATYPGKNEQVVKWTEHTTQQSYGVIDLNKAVGKHMGAAAYAYAVVTSPGKRPVQIRVGSNNSIKIFLNGKQVFFHEEYHHGQRMDQYTAPAILQEGRNELLLKVCQNEQKEDWAQTWSFQLRICDDLGGSVPMTVNFDKATPAKPANGKGKS